MVHGAAQQIQELAQKQNVQPSSFDSTGVTDAAILQIAIEAANQVIYEVMSGLSANVGSLYVDSSVGHLGNGRKADALRGRESSKWVSRN